MSPYVFGVSAENFATLALENAAAVAEYQAGNVERADQLFAAGRAQDPQKFSLVVDHAKLMLLDGRLNEARQLLRTKRFIAALTP